MGMMKNGFDTAMDVARDMMVKAESTHWRRNFVKYVKVPIPNVETMDAVTFCDKVLNLCHPDAIGVAYQLANIEAKARQRGADRAERKRINRAAAKALKKKSALRKIV